MQQLLLAFCLLFAYVSAQCSCSAPLGVATYNTMQIPISGAREPRLTATIDYFQRNSGGLDFLCLQELWEPAQRQRVINSLNSTFPYSLQGARIPNTCSPSCSVSDSEAILNCGFTGDCSVENSGFSFFSCAINQCRLGSSVSERCERCLLSLGTGITATSKLEGCAGWERVGSDLDTSCQFLFNGETDSLLLSRHRFARTDVHYYSISPFTSWSVLYGEIQHPTYGPIHAFCTHVVANQPFVDLSQENLAESIELVQYIQNITAGRSGQPIFIMGDFNHGPRTRINQPLFPASFNYITNHGYTATEISYPIRAGTEIPCTLCSDNPLRSRLAANYVIDHIYLNSGASWCVNSTSTFLNQHIVTVGDRSFPPSDHYGVRGSYCPSSTALGPLPSIPMGSSSPRSFFGHDMNMATFE